tara:strand:+ start:399 stop:845 length:447 start_codon:yes stop_codon:yes gene_type:complete
MNLGTYNNIKSNQVSSKSDNFEKKKLGLKRKSKYLNAHKIFDCLNISIMSLIFTLTFLSLNSQRKWTNYYSLIKDIRIINNNLVDKISKTEEFYIKEIDNSENIKKATSRDLIYLNKSNKEKKMNLILKSYFSILKGIKDGKYQRGNL